MRRMEAKRKEIDQKREAAYQRELKEQRQREAIGKPATSGLKRPKDKGEKKTGEVKKGEIIRTKDPKGSEEQKRVGKIPCIRKKGGGLPGVRAADKKREEKRRKKPLAEIMASLKGGEKMVQRPEREAEGKFLVKYGKHLMSKSKTNY